MDMAACKTEHFILLWKYLLSSKNNSGNKMEMNFQLKLWYL